MKKILGLDLGTNSIGWAVVENDFKSKIGKIVNTGSRIIPMSQDVLGKFDSGQSISQTADRTKYRGVRRLYQRDNLRRERLHRVLNILGFLPEHYKSEIDFEKKLGQFKSEVKLNYRKKSNNSYEFIFMDSFNEMVKEFREKGIKQNIPFDWTLYYLRKKALVEKITKEEIAWILLNFNQKRGYYQLRGEEEEIDKSKEKTFEILIGKEAVENGETLKKTGEKLYDLYFTNGWKYDKPIAKPEKWIEKAKEFIVTKTITKSGDEKRTFKTVDSEKDWIAIKTKTQQDIDKSGKFICEFIYESLLSDPSQKIRGKLIKTIERNYYKKELIAILNKQIEFHDELNIDTEIGKKLYFKSINELYNFNEAHRNNIKNRGFDYLFIDDIIFYQRPLKSKKSNIGDCQYEYRTYIKEEKDSLTGEFKKTKVKQPLKAIPKSHPLFQEFRLWQFIRNLRIYQKEENTEGEINLDIDVTSQLFELEEDWVKLFDFLNTKKDLTQNQLIDFLVKAKYIEKANKNNYRWNYVEDKKYPMSETRAQFLNRLKKVGTSGIVLSDDEIIKLWHIIYSVSDKEQYLKALKTFAIKYNIDVESFVLSFAKFKPFDSDYAAYSEKAIKKMLPLMRRGKYWDKNNIEQEVQIRISEIMERVDALALPKQPTKKQITEAFENKQIADDDIQKPLIKSFIEFIDKNPLSGLNTYQAAYAVYGRHSEMKENTKWHKPEDIDDYLKKFKQHSLRNPIVEQVVTETLRTVRDIWKVHGDFDEIHLELGREMKNPADKRKKLTQRNQENENTNHRIKLILKELMNAGISEVKYYSPSHQEILKIYEEGVLQNPNSKYDKLSENEIEKIRKNSKPSQKDIIKYKLWLEQGYISPYTGETISLKGLFTTDYQIEHIIPQSRYFDNSISNKVICESDINQLKGNKTAYEFIKAHKGQIVTLSNGKQVKIFDIYNYQTHCNRYFNKNKTKLKKLLSEDIPDSFIERQMNDSRYISKLIKGLLNNIVREDNEQSETSKNLIPITGTITSKLKQEWGLNDKWNEIILPRFKRLNILTQTNNFTYLNTEGKVVPTVPDELQKGFNKKRIDHRHHAIDAIVIACCTRLHIQYLNSLNNEKERYNLQPTLLVKNAEGNYTKHFQMPWISFPADVKNSIENIIVSFKQNLRVINKATNYYYSFKNEEGDIRLDKNGKPKKGLIKQKGENWAIRKPLHKETVSGKINFRASKGKIATAVRTSLSDIKTKKHLDKITDKSIVRILENHLKNYIDDKGNEDFTNAFSPDGIEELNNNIIELNDGKNHKPIYKVRLFEVGSKFALSDNKYSPKSKKYVEAAKGTNLYFAVYETINKKGEKVRNFDTIPLNVVIEHQKQSANLPVKEQTPIPFDNTKGNLIFTLSPNDLVYVPTDEEIINIDSLNFNDLNAYQINRIYKMVSSSGSQCFFLRNDISTSIVNKKEFSALNKMEKDLNGIMIKDKCIKLKVDRLGNIQKA